jgi:hypothetical protein
MKLLALAIVVIAAAVIIARRAEEPRQTWFESEDGWEPEWGLIQ